MEHSIRGKWLMGAWIGLLAAMMGATASKAALPTATALRIDSSVKIDGRLDEPFWDQAKAQSGFLVLARRGGVTAERSDQTAFKIAFDGNALYLGITCKQPDMDRIIAKVKDRDGPVWSDDAIEVFLRHGGPYFYHFAVNSIGTRFDMRPPAKRDRTAQEMRDALLWDGVWEAAARRQADGWTVEMRIPLATLEVGPGTGNTWRLNIGRHFAHDKKNDSWAPVEQGFGDPARQGYLKGIDIQPNAFPLDGAALKFPPMLLGENHVKLQIPAQRPGPYQVRATLGSAESAGQSRPVYDKMLQADQGQLTIDLMVPVKQIDATEKLQLEIDDGATHRPVLLRSYLFRAASPMEASIPWAVYYDTDSTAQVDVQLAVAPNLAHGQLVATLQAQGKNQPLVTQEKEIASPGRMMLDMPLANLPSGYYRLDVTARLVDGQTQTRQLWFTKVRGPFSKSP